MKTICPICGEEGLLQQEEAVKEYNTTWDTKKANAATHITRWK